MPVPSETVPVGSQAPDFTLTSIQGEQVRLADYRGRNVVLVFLRGVQWPLCRPPRSRLRDRSEECERRDPQSLAIAPDTLEHARDFFQRHEIPFPCLADPDRLAYRQDDVKSAMGALGER